MKKGKPPRFGVACLAVVIVLIGWKERALSQYVAMASPGSGGAAGTLPPPWDQGWAKKGEPDCSDPKASYDPDCWDCQGSPPTAAPKFSWNKVIVKCPVLKVVTPSNSPVLFCLNAFETNQASASAPGYTITQKGLRRWEADPAKCGDPHEEEFGFSEVKWKWAVSGVDATPPEGEGELAEFEYEIPENDFTISVQFEATGIPEESVCSESKDSAIVTIHGNLGKISLGKEYFGIVQPEEDDPAPTPDQGSATLSVSDAGIQVVDYFYSWQLAGVCIFDPPPGQQDQTVTIKENGTPSGGYLAESVTGTKTVIDAEGKTFTCTRQTNFTVVAVNIEMGDIYCGVETNSQASFPAVIALKPQNLPVGNEVAIIRSSSPVDLLFEDSALTIPAQGSYPASRFPLTLYHRLDYPGSYRLKAQHNLSRAQDRADYKIVRVEIAGPSNVCVQCAIQLSAKGGDAPYQWESSNPSVASVDANGLVTGLTPGKATITATDKNGCKGEKIVFVPKFELLMPLSACDGLVVPIELLMEPAHVKQHIVNVTFSATKPDGSTSFDNPSGQGITISQVGQDWTTWQIDNVRWYSTQPDHCNDTSEYKIQAFITLDTCADCKATNYLFTADFTLPSKCADGAAGPYQYWSGTPAYNTVLNTNSGLYETTVAQGTFRRDVQASSSWHVASNSQYHDMIMNEEIYHETQQMENPNHVRWGTCFLAANVMNQVWAAQPYVHSNAQQSQSLAENAFEVAKRDERNRSLAYLDQLIVLCADELEAKSAVGASHRASYNCTYVRTIGCPP